MSRSYGRPGRRTSARLPIFESRLPIRRAEQPELARAPRRVGPRAAVELAQDVAHVGVDRAGADEQLLGDLAVGATDREQPHDAQLAPREALLPELLGLQAAEAPVGLLAHPGEAGRQP